MTRYQKLENEVAAGRTQVAPVLLEDGLGRLGRYMTHNPPQEGLPEMRELALLLALLLRAVVDRTRGGRAVMKYPHIFQEICEWEIVVSRAFWNFRRTPEKVWGLEEKPSYRSVPNEYVIGRLHVAIIDLERWAKDGPERGTIPTNETDETLERIVASVRDYVQRIPVPF